MCGLANLAGRFALSIGVEVGCGLANKHQKQQSQANREQPRQTWSRILPATHLHFQITPNLPLTLFWFSSEQRGSWTRLEARGIHAKRNAYTFNTSPSRATI